MTMTDLAAFLIDQKKMAENTEYTGLEFLEFWFPFHLVAVRRRLSTQV